MPKPHDGETEKDFVQRCVPVLVSEGKDQKQAVAICYSMYREHRKKGKKDDR